jgi:hypothetical protein
MLARIKADPRGSWRGEKVACVASGPSLTADDVEQLRGRCKVIVVNTSFRMAPWADALYAMDSPWHQHHRKELEQSFGGQRYGLYTTCAAHGAVPMCNKPHFFAASNSGAGAIGLALYLGASRILLLGYDGKPSPAGQVHWHPDHPKGLSNGKSMPRWPNAMRQVASRAKVAGVPVVNCSRDTIYDAFPRGSLAEQLLVLAQVA